MQCLNRIKYIIRFVTVYFFPFYIWICYGCNKLVDIPEPINSVTTNEIFSTDVNATTAMVGAYSNLSFGKGSDNFAIYSLASRGGMLADELRLLGNSTDAFQTNSLLEDNPTVFNEFWAAMYNTIYNANAILEGVNSSSTLTNLTKKQLTGEAEFLRAFNNFYLVNLFGDVPLITTTKWANNNLLYRASAADVYKRIITDLKEAQGLLTDNYEFTGGERSRANKWAATALLARTYLYTGNWSDAETQATSVINNKPTYSILDDLKGVFLKNNIEAIWQLEIVDQYPYATKEGYNFVPYPGSDPAYYLTPELLSAFEDGDHRRIDWLDSSISSGVYYYYPYKYKIREGTPGNSSTEAYTLLRLAEQYLIRAEARTHMNNLDGAIEDLNVIRRRAGLTDIASSLNQSQLLIAIAQENRVEFFSEQGHRWLDLKRTGEADAVLSPIKGVSWQTTDQLFPIPLAERRINPNLTQNQGY